MTQAVSNNLNNLQELMSQVNQAQNKITETSDAIANNKASEKLVDFSKVFEKQIAKEDKKTLGDLKLKKIGAQDENNWTNFQEILSKATGEANIETSLDLTLARDINEIISQLKEAIDETIDETEDIVEKTDVVEEITTQTIGENSVLDELVAEDELAENEDTEENSLDNSSFLGQVLNYANNTELNSKVETLSIKVTKEVSENISENMDTSISEFETFEEFNNLTAEDTTKSTETAQNTLEQLIDEDVLKELNIESLEAQADTAGDSLMDSQTPQEQAVKAMLASDVESFDFQLDKTGQSQQVQNTQTKTVDVNPSKILDQITKQLKGLQNNSKVNIVLNPESLGKVTIQLIKTGEGLSAQFTVANQEVRDMLMKGLDGLKDTLASQGVGVDNVTVKLNESQKSEYNADWTEQEDSRGGNKEQGRSNKEEKEKGLFEQMMAQNLEEENGNV